MLSHLSDWTCRFREHFLFFSFFYIYLHVPTSRLPTTYRIINLRAEISGWTNLSISTSGTCTYALIECVYFLTEAS